MYSTGNLSPFLPATLKRNVTDEYKCTIMYRDSVRKRASHSLETICCFFFKYSEPYELDKKNRNFVSDNVTVCFQGAFHFYI